MWLSRGFNAGTVQGTVWFAEPLSVSDDNGFMGELTPFSWWEVGLGSAAEAKPDIIRSKFPVKFRLSSSTKK